MVGLVSQSSLLSHDAMQQKTICAGERELDAWRILEAMAHWMS